MGRGRRWRRGFGGWVVVGRRWDDVREFSGLGEVERDEKKTKPG